MLRAGDIDRNLHTNHWDGSAWEGTISAAIEAVVSPGTADGVWQGTPGAFAYIPYNPWSRNWRFYAGTDTTDTPTNALAAENTTPTGFDRQAGKFRLRFSVIELSGMAQTDARKKLQYATGTNCTPNTVEGDTDCSWTDVDDAGGSGIWRYVDCNNAPSTVCDDNTVLGGTVLSDASTAGWWTQQKSGGTVTNMDHAALGWRELEYSVEANDAIGGTYYFRMYDVDQGRPVLREQDNDGSNDCASAACTYPSITTTAGVSISALMRHGNYFNGGVEQSFFWAD